MIRMKTIFYLTAVILCSAQYFMCKEGVSYKFQRNACNKFNKKFISNITCKVRHINRTTQIINVEINIQPNVSLANLRLDYTTYIKFRTVFRPSLIKTSEHLCDYLNEGTYSHFFNAIRNSYAKFSNALDPCPKTGVIYFRNMVIDTTKFPQFLPIGEYRIDDTIYTYINGKEEFVLLYQDYIEVKPLGILEF